MAESQQRKSIADLLLNSARQDQAAAAMLGACAEISDAMFGFHAQQAIEKCIKAVLSHQRIEFRKTHDLIALLDLLQDNALQAPPHAGWLDELNPYAVEARYGAVEPFGLDRRFALTAVNDVLIWAELTLR